MHRSGAQLVRYALEQLNTEQTFGVVGDLNRAIYSELQQSSIHTHLVNQEISGKNIAHFERSYKYAQHDHLICQDCGKVFEFCDPRIQQIQNTAGEILDFNITNHSLNFYGSCKKLASGGKCDRTNQTN